MRIDLHVHSQSSIRPSQWILRKIGCPESFTDPMQIYHLAKKKGMSLVTITDHNSISGSLKIAHLPDTFVSEEITTYFPENGCKVHVLAFNITEKQHLDIQKARSSIYDLVEFLAEEDIVHVLAHPLYKVNDQLTVDHFEKFLLLFKNFEINGTRNNRENQALRYILSCLTPNLMEQLTQKHNILPHFANAWQKNLVGGSDDHSSLNIARTYTEIRGAVGVASALSGIQNGQAAVFSNPSSPQTMAHNLYGITYQYYKNKFNLERYVDKDILMRFLDRTLRNDIKERSDMTYRLSNMLRRRKHKTPDLNDGEPLTKLLQSETRKLIRNNSQLMDITKNGTRDVKEIEKKWFDFVNQVSNRTLLHFADHLMDHLSGGNVFNIFHTIGSAGGLYTLMAPYFVAYSIFTKDRRFTDAVVARFNGEDIDSKQKQTHINVAHFTDTFYEINGVALSLQQQVKVALKNNKRLTVITCNKQDNESTGGIKNFVPVGIYELPEYPEQKIFYPPLLEMLNYCYENNFTHIHSATPGLIGLVALAIAHILKLPIVGTYHTQIPQYAQHLTGDNVIEDLTWKYVLWYYNQMDIIYAPSQSTKSELTAKGIHPEKIHLFPRGIDIQRFHPSKRNGYVESHYKIKDAIKLLYVGRISKEKNLPLLVDVFHSLVRERGDLHLIVVGDGPYLTEMQQRLAKTPCTITGYLNGESLASIYASSDIFVFPSTTDTFGNVVLEAQASGIPVIITDQGGPLENMEEGKTGLVAKGNDFESLREKILTLANNDNLANAMGKNARRHMENRSFEFAYLQTWRKFSEIK